MSRRSHQVLLGLALGVGLTWAANPLTAGDGGRRSRPAPDLSGRWLLTLPAGFEYRVDLQPRGGLYRLDAAEMALNNEGLYRVRGDHLEVVEPDDARLTGFLWKIHNANTLILVGQPDVSRTGSDYLGATLTRQVR